MKHHSVAQQGPPRYQVIHRVHCEVTKERVMYLEEPWTVHAGRYRFHLRGSQQVSNMELYLERNKDVTFLVLRDYVCCAEKSYSHHATRSRLGKDVDSRPASMLVEEHIDIVSNDLESRLANLADVVFQGIPHPKFGRVEEDEEEAGNDYDDEYESGDYNGKENPDIYYPYLWFYHRRPNISTTIERLEEIDQGHLNLFCGYIQHRMSEEWNAVDKLLSKREITAEFLRYIYVSLIRKPLALVSNCCRSRETL